ncbi:MAG: ProQ/FinO family protein [Pelagimonas sp.]|jgi:sRNA-binding protein|nr:ProQ/FinO family protein [Pelagimonas sp.]
MAMIERRKGTLKINREAQVRAAQAVTGNVQKPSERPKGKLGLTMPKPSAQPSSAQKERPKLSLGADGMVAGPRKIALKPRNRVTEVSNIKPTARPRKAKPKVKTYLPNGNLKVNGVKMLMSASKRFPKVFNKGKGKGKNWKPGKIKPLAIGIAADLQKGMGWSEEATRAFMSWYTYNDDYQAALAADGSMRFGLDGEPTGPVDESHRAQAQVASGAAERRALKAERRAKEEAWLKKRAEMAAALPEGQTLPNSRQLRNQRRKARKREVEQAVLAQAKSA